MKLILFASLTTWLTLQPVLAGGPDYALRDLDVEEHAISDYHGKWVIVNYWSTRCVPMPTQSGGLLYVSPMDTRRP